MRRMMMMMGLVKKGVGSASASTAMATLTTPHPNCCILTSSTSDFMRKRRRSPILCCLPLPSKSKVGRREASSSLMVLLHAASTSASASFSALLPPAFSFITSPTPAFASPPTDAPPQFRPYSDEVNKYMMFIPQDWEVGVGETDGIKSITAFYPSVDSASNVSVVITGLGPDLTRLESFGKVDTFAESLVTGLDRSWQRPPGVTAKLIDCKAANGLYYIEYTLQNPGESRRHIYSAIGMANANGWYNRLYTVTGQFVEEDADKYSSNIQKVVQSFRLG